jgi:hypothetical protein
VLVKDQGRRVSTPETAIEGQLGDNQQQGNATRCVQEQGSRHQTKHWQKIAPASAKQQEIAAQQALLMLMACM